MLSSNVIYLIDKNKNLLSLTYLSFGDVQSPYNGESDLLGHK